MGVELDLSELAVLRPIQTTASSGGAAAATARRGNDDDLVDAADDTGCVTPTAMSSFLPLRQGGVAGVDLIVDAVVFSTPTSSPCLLRPSMVCPPAPRKPAMAPAAPAAAKRKRCCEMSFFPVPQDLSTVFVPRAAAAPSCQEGPPPVRRGVKRLRGGDDLALQKECMPRRPCFS